MQAVYLDAIKKFEGFTARAAADYKQLSNGYGTRARFAGEVIDSTEADRRFATEISEARAIVEKFAGSADEGTKAALTSLTFNAGSAWTKSGLGEAVQRGDLDKARELFVQYNKAGGEVLPGLVNRRMAEVQWIGAGVANEQVASTAAGANAIEASSSPARGAMAAAGMAFGAAIGRVENAPVEGTHPGFGVAQLPVSMPSPSGEDVTSAERSLLRTTLASPLHTTALAVPNEMLRKLLRSEAQG